MNALSGLIGDYTCLVLPAPFQIFQLVSVQNIDMSKRVLNRRQHVHVAQR